MAAFALLFTIDSRLFLISQGGLASNIGKFLGKPEKQSPFHNLFIGFIPSCLTSLCPPQILVFPESV